MYTAAELIQALQRRLQLKSPHSRLPPGEFPPGWQAWFDRMATRVGKVTGATAQAYIEIFLARPLTARPPRTGELTRWQAFATLWRQEWHAPAPEERRTHLVAATITLLWHVFFIVFLLWLMYTRFMALEAEQRRGEDVVQIEMVGVGTPKDVGGGRIPEVREQPEPAQAAEAAQPQAEAPAETTTEEAAPEMPAPPIEMPAPIEHEAEPAVAQVEAREIPEPQPEPEPTPTPPVEQRVEVSAPTPEVSDYVLQAPTPPQITPRQVTARDVQARETAVEAREVNAPVSAVTRAVTQREVEARAVQARVPEVAVREVNTPIQGVRRVEVRTPSAPQATVRAPDTTVRAREVPAPVAATSSSTAASRTPSQATPATAAPSRPGTAATQAPGATATTTSPSSSPSTPAGGQPAAAAGQGPKPVSAPGAFPTRERDDDWGASTRNVPGGQQGEPRGDYNTTGGPRLGESPVNPGQPPGTLDDRIVDLDRSGTWLKRKPVGYEPTSLDKYWRPNETLLQEWVRKGIKRMAIPIPGTNKKIECIVSILQFGGGCGLSDPNINDQPAIARPPPDIPFKPELQDNNGSVKPPPGG